MGPVILVVNKEPNALAQYYYRVIVDFEFHKSLQVLH